MYDDVLAFQDSLARLPSVWEAIDIRTLAFHVDGVWQNAMTRCRLVSSAEKIRAPRYLPSTTRVRTFRQVVAASDLPRVLDALRTCTLDIDGTEVRFDRRETDASVHPYNVHWYEGLEARESYYGRDWVPVLPSIWTGFTLTAFGSAFHEILRSVPGNESALDEEIHGAHAPLDGIEGIAEHVVGLKADARTDRRAYFRLTAPFETRFEPSRSRLYAGSLQLRIESGSASVRPFVDVGFVTADREGVLVADTRTIEADEWQPSGDGSAQVSIPAPGADVATVLLRLGGRRIERLQLADASRRPRNPRHEAYELIDQDLAFLRKVLRGEGADPAKDFERACARLLALLGFQSIALGPEGVFKDDVDVIAFDPHGPFVLAVECTIGPLDTRAKLGKLVMRAGELATMMPDQQVQAVIVSAKPADVLSESEQQAAGRDGIAVLAAEDLLELVERAESNISAASAAEFIRSKIPQPPNRGRLPDVIGGLAWR